MQHTITSNLNPNFQNSDNENHLKALMHLTQLNDPRYFRPYPSVSVEKETALLMILVGYSYRKTADQIQKNHTIITQWAKNDTEFKRLLVEVKQKRQAFLRSQILPSKVEGVNEPKSSQNELKLVEATH
ncbi:hypothetical protein EHQ23_19705 [Leptospira bourretii]|uniref:Uncharacterized protein n=1 Tax=Leptospira bourretii TaxID=2484962 RepID=A0A4R9IGM1_9LEPT|nr:hypothetical protein [Leptospira bourretii]TGK78896.1 hypothetical protein EHQ23_19705 [Leptospira bourretii]TGK87565.1 hypothetical protein EHQ26_19890 [Leptospira bourretii]TGL40813.1 hypothetical protein EHQ45_03225 [Leptospira bourretii]